MGNKKNGQNVSGIFHCVIKNALVHSLHTQYHDCVTPLQMIIFCTVVYSAFAECETGKINMFTKFIKNNHILLCNVNFTYS